MTFEAAKDGSGFFWTIPADHPSLADIECWWNRTLKPDVRKDTEHFVIRQDNGEERADIIIMSQGQMYDLIKALNDAMEKP